MQINLKSARWRRELPQMTITLIRENRRIVFQAILAFLFIGLAIYFVKHERSELVQIRETLENASRLKVLAGVVLAAIYIVVQGLMYFFSFRSVNQRITLRSAMILFLKRNFVSVFLPAGGISSLAFFTRDIEEQQVTKSQIHFASSIYAFVGILSVVIVAVPAILISAVQHTVSSDEVYALSGSILLILLFVWAFRSIVRRGKLYQWIIKLSPSFEAQINEILAVAVNRKGFLSTVIVSVVIEFIGIAHLLIAMWALGLPISIEAAVMGYIISVLFLIASPFLRGLGAIELSLSFILVRYGYSLTDAVAATFLYRFFEFWLMLLAGAFSFLFVRNNLILRVLPVFLTFAVGIVNIVSALTPAIHSRVLLLRDFLPLSAIHISNDAVFAVGLMLLVVSAFLLKGSKTAWYMAMGLVVVSILGNLFKAIDYEEATLSVFLLIALVITRKQYYVQNSARLGRIGLAASLLTMLAVIIYGVVGFYFLDKTRFNIDFSFSQSVRYTIENFFLYRSDILHPTDAYARAFLRSINISGFLSMAFLIYSLIRPYVIEVEIDESEMEKAKKLVQKYGRSPLDYFKTYADKLLFFPEGADGFVSYRVAGNYAMVLENPVCANDEDMAVIILAFERFCKGNGMKSLYYRVPEESLPVYESLELKSLNFGQEAILEMETFNTDGKEKKSLRNSNNKLRDAGYTFKVHRPPVMDGTLQKIHAVSNDWLDDRGYGEMVFSQGFFDFDELKQQTILTIESPEEKVIAFANIMPDYAEGEATYDLIRKTKDAPNGTIEFLMVEMFFFLKKEGFKAVNMGFAPMAGIDAGRNFPEKSIRFAYEKLRSFAHYKGLKSFKDKFSPRWVNKYIIYNNDYDLFSLPGVLRKVIKP